MEHQKMLNLLNEASDSKFVTKKWNIVNDQSNTNYDIRNEIIYNTEVLKSNLCDYNDAFILVRCDISIIGDNGHKVAFKNCAPFTKSITKINETINGTGQMTLTRQVFYCFILKMKQLILIVILQVKVKIILQNVY